MKTVDFSLVSLKNLKQFCYSSDYLSDKNNIFTISLNENEFNLPLDIAICFSNSIFSLYKTDPTTRFIKFDIEFHNNNIIGKIINILTDENETNVKVNLENEEEIFDLALFGKHFGYEPFITPFLEYYSKQSQKITKENVFKLFDSFNFFGHFDIVDKLISFISENFYDFADKTEFIEWCCNSQNEERVEQIIKHEKLKLKNENQLLLFIIKLCKRNHYFEYLFAYVYLEYCDVECCKSFISYLSDYKNECQTHSKKNILQCIGRRLFQRKLPVSLSNNKARYKLECNITNRDKYCTISSNNGRDIPNKYYQKINDKTYKFLYPSEDSSTCNSVFKVTLEPGNYKLECVGASGGKGEKEEGGFGGYCCGVLTLSNKTDLFLYIGGKGQTISGPRGTISKGGFNGGGNGITGDKGYPVGSGGGATDIRINSESINDRIIVAGGGGGSAGNDNGESHGGDGGGLSGKDSSNSISSKQGKGASQCKQGDYNNENNINIWSK